MLKNRSVPADIFAAARRLSNLRSGIALLFVFCTAAVSLSAHPKQSASGSAQEPVTTTYCELAGDPAAYNHKLIRLTGFVTHGFEDFQLTEPNCPHLPYQFSIWLTYGGTTESNTVYCCPGEPGQKPRSESLTVEGVQVPLVRDEVFGQFTDLLKKEPDTTVRVTVAGVFFSGEKQESGNRISWGGAGHLGCCSLLAIQKVENFEPHTRTDVDYTAEAGWYEKEGCRDTSLSYKRHVSVTEDENEIKQAIAEQKLADGGERAWAFTDPQRVAVESLKPLYSNEVPVLRKVRSIAGRQVFRWKRHDNSVTVVVIRPYWLTFYASSRSIAWITSTIKEANCH